MQRSQRVVIGNVLGKHTRPRWPQFEAREGEVVRRALLRKFGEEHVHTAIKHLAALLLLEFLAGQVGLLLLLLFLFPLLLFLFALLVFFLFVPLQFDLQAVSYLFGIRSQRAESASN